METTQFTIKALDESTWDAFAALVEANGGVFGGCWCMGFHPEDRTHLDAPEPHR
jgi:Acetyltransferase (GNAT) family